MVLKEEDKNWIESAYTKGMTRLQIKRKLEEAKYKDKKIEEFLKYFDELDKEEKVEKLENEDDFKQDVKKYFSENKDNMTWGEKRAVKKFLKNTKKYSDVLKSTIGAIKQEIGEMKKRFEDETKIDKELEDVKKELIDRIIDGKIILDINDPITGEEATKENLAKNDLDSLIRLVELNIEDMDNVINGRIE